MTRPRHAPRQEQVSLFGDDLPPTAPAPRVNARPEAAALAEVLQTLQHHPAVAWVRRQNSGVARIGDRFVRFGWLGCADLLGQMKDGRLLAVECKAPQGRLTAEQAEFLSLVRRFGGVACLAIPAVQRVALHPGAKSARAAPRNAHGNPHGRPLRRASVA